MDITSVHRDDRDPVPAYTSDGITVPDYVYRPDVVAAFFAAITAGDADLVTFLLDTDPSLAQTSHTQTPGFLPLYAATVAGHTYLVALLAQRGAPIDELSATGQYYYDVWPKVPTSIMRTPLMAAASQGSLPLVKLLFNDLGADDSIVAPDGVIALRLAIAANHSAIIALLPARRSGGWVRFKHSQRKAIRRIRRAGHAIYSFTRLFVWDVPGFFLWTIPKCLLKETLPALGRQIWRAIKAIPHLPSLLYKLTERFVRGLWKVIVAIPRFTVDTIKLATWMSKETAKWVLKLVTRTIPQTIFAISKFVIRALAATGTFTLQFLKDVVSFFHTLIAAIITHFKAVTLKDVAHALYIVFVSVPKWIWSAIHDTMVAIKNGAVWLLKQLGGLVQFVFFLAYLLYALLMYIPRKIGQIAVGVGEIAAAGAHEVAWWINPKAGLHRRLV